MDSILWLPPHEAFDIPRIRALVEATLQGTWKITSKRDRVVFRQGTWWMSFRLETAPIVAAQREAAEAQLGVDLHGATARVVQRALFSPTDARFHDVLCALEAFQAIDGVTVVQIGGTSARVLPRP